MSVPYLARRAMLEDADAFLNQRAELPLRYLGLLSQQRTAEQTRVAAATDAYLEAVAAGSQPWREPELFWVLGRWVRHPELDLLDDVRFHCSPSAPLYGTTATFVRSPHQRGSVFPSREPDRGRALRWLARDATRFAPMCDGLFDDVIQDTSLRGSPDASAEESFEKVHEALNQIGAFSGELYNDIANAVSIVVSAPNAPSPGFSLRTNYCGGVFVNPLFEDGLQLAETLVHEFLHQRMWVSWTFSPPCDAVALSAPVCSPMTGRFRPAGALLQAHVIYAQAVEYYRWRVETRSCDWSARRLEFLSSRLAHLRSALMPAVGHFKKARDLVERVDGALEDIDGLSFGVG